MRAFALIRLVMLLFAGATPSAIAAQVADATGRTVQIPDKIVRVVPAGPPAAVLLEAVAPDLMLGWPEPMSDPARALLSPDAARQPQIPRLTGRDDVSAKIAAFKPDLILDYGTVSPRYAELAEATQRRTGVPTILLDGAMDKIPQTIRTLGEMLHRQARAETIAHFAEALLLLPPPSAHSRVLYARGPDGLMVAAPDTDVTAVFARLGWQALAPAGAGTFRPSTIDAIRALDPDILIFADPVMADVIAHNETWHTLRAVRDGHAFIAPHLPFGWIEEPPSVNRLIGLAWLGGHDPVTLATMSNAILYGHTLTSAETQAVLTGVRSIQP